MKFGKAVLFGSLFGSLGWICVFLVYLMGLGIPLTTLILNVGLVWMTISPSAGVIIAMMWWTDLNRK